MSGGSRLVLIERVIEVTMRNPITGLGPAAYRPYANMAPLQYGRAFWITSADQLPQQLRGHLRPHRPGGAGAVSLVHGARWLGWLGGCAGASSSGFVAGYVNGMLAAWAGIMVVMLLLDWFLPFVYNVGFPGFQASVLVWLFLGGLVAIEQWPPSPSETSEPDPER